MTERLHFHFSLSCIGEGNGNPLQCSCLKIPRDRGVLLGCRLWGRTESDTTDVIQQQQQQAIDRSSRSSRSPDLSQVAESKSKEKVEARAFTGVSAGKARQGKQFRTVQFEYLWQALSIGVISSCLVTQSQDDLGQEKYWLGCVSLTRRKLKVQTWVWLVCI